MKQTPEYAMLEGSKNISGDLPDNQHDLERMGSEIAILDLPEVKDIPGQEHIKVMLLGEMADTTISSADEEGAGILDFDERIDGDDDEDEIGTDDENSVVIDTGDEDDLGDEDIEDDEPDEAEIINEDDPEEDFGDEDFIIEDEDADFDEEEDIDIEEEDDEELDEDLPRAGLKNPSVNVFTDSESFNETGKEYREAIDVEISEEEISMLENSGPVEADSDTDNLNRSQLDQTDFEGDVLNEVESTQNVAGNDLDVPGSEMDDANEKIGEEDEENNVYSRADTDT